MQQKSLYRTAYFIKFCQYDWKGKTQKFMWIIDYIQSIPSKALGKDPVKFVIRKV